MNLIPYNKIVLKPRSETIVRAATNRNEVGIVRAEETAPGIYIGRCLVEPINYICPVSVINTTDETVEIQTPYVTLDDVGEESAHGIYTVQAEKSNKLTSPKNKRI